MYLIQNIEVKMEVSHISHDLLVKESPYSYVFLCPSPCLPGHLVICPKRRVRNLSSLSDDEFNDISRLVLRLSAILEVHLNCTSFTIESKDGVYNHAFVNIIPRFPHDLAQNDEIYMRIEKMEFKQENIELNDQIEGLKAVLSDIGN